MRVPALRIFLWLVGFAALFGNLLVFTFRLVMEKGNQTTFSGFVSHLSASDFLMGAYLLIIAVTDSRYRGHYYLYDQSWRSSLLCKCAWFLSTVSSETSAMLIFLITLDRFLIIRFPFGQVRFTKLTMHICCGFAWLIGFLIALIPLLPPFRHWIIYSTNGMCVGLPLSVYLTPGWPFAVAVFVGFNFLLFLLIAFGQLAIYRSLSQKKSNSLGASKRDSRRRQETAIAKRLSLIVMSDFLCWFPVGVMGIVTRTGHEISEEVYIWTAIVVLPINSALNPLLYTLGAVRDRWANMRELKRRRQEMNLTPTKKNTTTSGQTVPAETHI